MENHNYGKLKPDNDIAYAPATIADERGVIANPNEAQYRARGYLPIVGEPPTRLGVEFVPTESGDIGERGGRAVIVRRYDERPIVAPPVVNRHWTKLKLKTALATAGWLAQVKAILAGIEIAPGYSAAEAFADCDYIEERWPDAERWNAMLDGIAAQLGKTRDEIDAFLDGVPTDNGEVAA